jgi:hypothetical protein
MGIILGPFIILYFVIAFYLTRYAWRTATSPRKKYINSLFTFFVFVFLFAGDSLIGNAILQGICAYDGGITINETVELDDTYFNKNDELALFTKKYRHAELNIEEKYFGKYELNKDMWLPYMSKSTWLIVNNSGETISKYRRYNFRGGWFVRLGRGNSYSCPKKYLTKEFLHQTFLPKT